MQVSRKEGKLLTQAIREWEGAGLLNTGQADQLQGSLNVTSFDWKRVAKYSFWMAVACIVISVSAVLADRWLLELFERLFSAPASVKSAAFAVVAGSLYLAGLRRQRKHPDKLFSNEAVLFLGVVATAFSVMFLGAAIDTGSGHFSLLLLLAALIYAALGLWFSSKLIWVFALLSLGSWFGAETGYASGWGAYYLGMNYPLRFVLFGLVLLLAGSVVFRQWPSRRDFLQPTRVMGLLYLFVALWILSIFGNYGDGEAWFEVRQIELLHWSVLFALASVAAIYHGIRFEDGVTRGFGLTFLFINLYTRFFEYFWDTTHKAIFFALLAASFWYLGSHAERIWRMNPVRKWTQDDER